MCKTPVTYSILPAFPVDNERCFWIIVSLISVSAGLIILAAVGFYLFKVDLVLAYRSLCSPVTTHTGMSFYILLF